jgi:uncharacterized protein GlcG (DUF336 family)
MRTTRLAVSLAVLLSATGLNAAQAAARKPLCLQVVDPSGDGTALAGQKSDAVDIVSGDIATGKRNLVAAMRLSSVEADQFQATGASYIWSWTVGGVAQSVAYHVYADGSATGRFDADTSGGSLTDEQNVTAVADRATNTITWTVPRKLVAALKGKGAKFSAFTLTVKLGVNHRVSGEGRSQIIESDRAQAGKTYVDGTSTCLKGT